MSRQEKVVIIFLLLCAAAGLSVSFYKNAHPPPIKISQSGFKKDAGPVTINKNIININKSGEEELTDLPGIGPALAKRIIAYRRENGLFDFPEDITKVPGIGKAKYEHIKDIITTEDE